jgi:cyclic beta-1,2-glucan synthetase
MTLANGLGGFTDDGHAYTIALDGAEETPMPWTNIIANAQFGTVITASGSAHTWSGNSRENRLTPFANDPIVDPTGEALFVRDDETGESWSPTAGPIPRATAGDVLFTTAPASRASRAQRTGLVTNWTSSSMPSIRCAFPCSRWPMTARGPHAQRLRVQRVDAWTSA